MTFTCADCGGKMRRVPEVIDAWYDSGAMPFGQLGYPHLPGSVEEFERTYPAQFICEALDQTRGWFYSLMAVGTLVFDRSSYENVVCLGLILAEDGRKMSKHLGNILEPIPLMDQHGADALRWFMLAPDRRGSPQGRAHGAAGRRPQGPADLLEHRRRSSPCTAGRPAGRLAVGRAGGRGAAGARPVGRCPSCTGWWPTSMPRYEGFDVTRAGARLAEFVDDLSNWYVRRSRRRFWDGDPAALATLHTCLETLTRLLAPMAPFITERVWQDLVRPVTPDAAESVHLASFPVADPELVDDELSRQMALVRRLVELGRAARAESKVRTRQPLARALVAASGFADAAGRAAARGHRRAQRRCVDTLGAAGDLVDVSTKGNFRTLGRRFAKDTPRVAAAIAAADGAGLAASLRESGVATVTVAGLGEVEVGPDDVIVTETPRSGWAVASDRGETVALDLELTPELVRAGLVREAIRLVQEARKASGFDVSDRIRLAWEAAGELAEALRADGGLLADEVLAVEVSEGLAALPDAPITRTPTWA